MGYFDGLTDASFRKDAQGRDVFYPYGSWSRGRILPDDETAARLRASIKRFYVLLMLGLPLLVVIVRQAQLSLLYLLLLALAWVGIAAVYLESLTRGLPRSEERLTWRESVANSLRGHSMLGLVLLAIVSAGFVALGVFILSLDPAANLGLALAEILFFGLCLVVFLVMLVLKFRQGRAGLK